MPSELNKVKCDLNNEVVHNCDGGIGMAEFTTLTKLLLQTALMVLDSPLVTFQSSVGSMSDLSTYYPLTHKELKPTQQSQGNIARGDPNVVA